MTRINRDAVAWPDGANCCPSLELVILFHRILVRTNLRSSVFFTHGEPRLGYLLLRYSHFALDCLLAAVVALVLVSREGSMPG